MRKVIAMTIAVLLVVSCMPALAEGTINITIDGDAKVFDVMPVLDNDRTLVPLRGIFETLGAQVEWDDTTWSVTATKGETTVELQIDNKIAKVNGKEVELDVPAKLINERTMVPVRFVSESLGCKVDWIDETQTVVITSAEPKEQTNVRKLLDGKKVIFIGNSYVYYGNCVINPGRTAWKMEDRNSDKGYFYQLCKANGAEVSVTNWCFSGHTLYTTFDGPCNTKIECSGVDHEAELTERYYDYVFISPHASAGEESGIKENFAYVVDFFKKYNPDVKIVLLGNHAVYGINNKDQEFPGIYNYYKELEKQGIIIADWGSIVRDIVKNSVAVPGGTLTYNKRTFINTDEYHENPLGGYITALTAFCAITGAKAEGQPYDFCWDTSVSSKFDLEKYKADRCGDSNFIEVFESEADMKGLQKMVDWLFK